MNNIVDQFLHRKIYVKWNTQDEIEHLADIIDQMTGKHYDRKYMRGYEPSRYAYWGMDTFNGSYVYCLYGGFMGRIYSYDEFLALLGVQDEQYIDISSLL